MTLSLADAYNPFHQTGETWLLEFHVPFHAVDAFSEALEYIGVVSAFEDDERFFDKPTEDHTRWKLSVYCEDQPESDAIERQLAHAASEAGIHQPGYILELLPAHDWVDEVQKNFQPIEAGRFFVHSSFYDGPKPQGKIPLHINASRAFGTGEHQTTSGCLEALSFLAKQYDFGRMLDMGCGTGILSIAMAKLFRRPVIAVDINPVSVGITQDNLAVNHVEGLVTARVSDGYRNPIIKTQAPYDLIVANILADPLIAFAPQLAAHMAPGGVAVLSGLLHFQENNVLHAHRKHGLHLWKRIRRDQWSVLLLRR